jgi:penicillin-binding protein 2
VEQWWKKRFGYSPQPNEIMALSIGQGPDAQSVLNMAAFYSALAAGGRSVRPHLRKDSVDTKDVIDLKIAPESMKALFDGMGQVTEEGGTAYLSALGRWKLYGKTGTSENPPYVDHGWFAGFAGPPNGAPEVVAVAIVEHGRHGSDVAPLVAKAAEYYLDEKHHIPIDKQPTLIERWNSNRCPWGVNCIPGQKGGPLATKSTGGVLQTVE